MTAIASTEVKDEIVQIIDQAKRFFETKDIPLYESINIAPEKIEQLYLKAAAFYSAEKYQQAAELFESMVLYNHKDPKNWIGLAASNQMLKNYKTAIDGYSRAFSLDPTAPAPLIHLYECYLALQDYPRAIASLESVILITQNRPEYSEVRTQAESLKEILKKNASDKTTPTLAPL